MLYDIINIAVMCSVVCIGRHWYMETLLYTYAHCTPITYLTVALQKEILIYCDSNLDKYNALPRYSITFLHLYTYKYKYSNNQC